MLHNPYSNHYHNIESPPTPFQMDIPNGLVAGKQIFISGAFNPNGDQLKIDLICHNGDIALHFNPRIGQGCVVRNSNLGGWGAEEKDGQFPFKRGRNFEVIILVDNEKYLIAVNGQHMFEFRHRCPFQEIGRLHVGGDVRVNRIVFSGGAHANPNEVHNPSTPFTIPITHGLAPGRLIQISGQVPPNAQKFAVNLQNGPGNYPNDIALHFNPRYNDGAPYVCKNSRQGGAWGAELRDSANPIAPGTHFDLLILAEPNEFKVAVNGVHFTSFPRRNDFSHGNHINVEGDVLVHAIRQF